MRKSIANIMWISIAASVLTIALKWLAFSITGSVGFMSDAMESGINLIAGIVAFYSLTVAARPADKEHPFGHDKAEYFSSLAEGVLIVIAAFGIAYAAINRLYHPQPLESLDYGMLLSVAATVINLITARILLYYSKKYNSITIEADAHHLMTDVWTTVGIIAGIFLVKLTGWQFLDPIMAILVAISIVYTGIKLIIRSMDGLMDSRLSEKEMVLIREVLDRYKSEEIDYHALYTRRASAKQFITFHLLFPGDFTVNKAHDLTKQIENELKTLMPYSDVFIHVEPINDPDAFEDSLKNEF